MDPHSEHGDGLPMSNVSSAPASEAEALERAGPSPAAAPSVAASSPASADSAEGPRHGAANVSDAAPSTGPDADPADTLSPAVRRLVRQYDLDITGVYGSGPAGKIRVGDIIGMLDGRAEPRGRLGDGAGRASAGAAHEGALQAPPSTPHEARVAPAEVHRRSTDDSAAADAAWAAPTTTVFECDVSRVLSHRKRKRQGDVELLLASYFVAACLEALGTVPEILVGSAGSTQRTGTELSPRLGVLLATTDGTVRRALVDSAGTSSDERLGAIDAQLRTSVDDDLRAASLLLHDYAASGSLLATPTAIGVGHAGSIGIGRMRREIVVKTVDGQEAPRVAALCYLTLTFRPERIALERANRFVAEWVRVIEQWPIEQTTVV